jgi:hypothetical protein
LKYHFQYHTKKSENKKKLKPILFSSSSLSMSKRANVREQARCGHCNQQLYATATTCGVDLKHLLADEYISGYTTRLKTFSHVCSYSCVWSVVAHEMCTLQCSEEAREFIRRRISMEYANRQVLEITPSSESLPRIMYFQPDPEPYSIAASSMDTPSRSAKKRELDIK